MGTMTQTICKLKAREKLCVLSYKDIIKTPRKHRFRGVVCSGGFPQPAAGNQENRGLRAAARASFWAWASARSLPRVV